jgi:hypothetical protein
MVKPSRILAAQKFLSTAQNDNGFWKNVFTTEVGLTTVLAERLGI